MRTSLLLPVFSFTSNCSAQLKPCYDADGNLTPLIPCDSFANVSACYFLGVICVTNLHCHGEALGDTFESVGGCTDKTGNDPAYPLPFLPGTVSSCYLLSLMKTEPSLLVVW